MGMFKRKAGIEGELVDAKRKRDQLKQKLEAAEAALADALRARRQVLLESEDDAGGAVRGVVAHARDEVDALADALTEIEEQIVAIQGRLVKAKEQAARDAAVSELRPHVDALVAVLDKIKVEGVAMAAAAAEVCKRVPLANQNFGRDLSDLFTGIGINVGEVITNARGHLEALERGDGRPKAPEAPHPPAIARISVVPVANVSWREGEEIKSAPRYSVWSIPENVARRGVDSGWLLLADSPAVAQMRAAEIYDMAEDGWRLMPPTASISIATRCRCRRADRRQPCRATRTPQRSKVSQW